MGLGVEGLVGFHDFTNQAVADHVGALEFDERDVLDLSLIHIYRFTKRYPNRSQS